MDKRQEWAQSFSKMMLALAQLGFPEALGKEIAKNLGSPKAMNRMTAYLTSVKPRKAEMVVDEMLAICSDVEAWKEKKASEEANAYYNDMLNRGLDVEENDG